MKFIKGDIIIINIFISFFPFHVNTIFWLIDWS